MNDSPLSLVKAPAFTTKQFATMKNCTLSAASKRLSTMSRQGHLKQLTRGIWVIPDHPHFSLQGCVPLLLGKEDGYISFLSALHMGDALSQIPKAIQVATTGHTRRLVTAFGRFEFFQLHPRMMGEGVEWQDTPLPFRLASLEKALLDTFYVATRRGRRFAKLPEIELSRDFRERNFRKMLNLQVHSEQIKSAILSRYEREFLDK